MKISPFPLSFGKRRTNVSSTEKTYNSRDKQTYVIKEIEKKIINEPTSIEYRQMLIEAYIDSAMATAQKFAIEHPEIDTEDAIQTAMLALTTEAMRYNPKNWKKTCFGSMLGTRINARLNSLVKISKENSNNIGLSALNGTADPISLEEKVARVTRKERLIDIITDESYGLNPKHARAILGRTGLNDSQRSKTFTEMGKSEKLTSEMIRKRTKEAIDSLRKGTHRKQLIADLFPEEDVFERKLN